MTVTPVARPNAYMGGMIESKRYTLSHLAKIPGETDGNVDIGVLCRCVLHVTMTGNQEVKVDIKIECL